jgi:hypothetical protein
MKRELALDHAAGRIDETTYLTQIGVLREEATRIDSGECPGTGIAPDKVVANLRARSEAWAEATPAGRANCCTRSMNGSSFAARRSSALD